MNWKLAWFSLATATASVALYLLWVWMDRPDMATEQVGRYELYQGKYETSVFLHGKLETFDETAIFRLDTVTGKTHLFLSVNGVYNWLEVDIEYKPPITTPKAPSPP